MLDLASEHWLIIFLPRSVEAYQFKYSMAFGTIVLWVPKSL